MYGRRSDTVLLKNSYANKPPATVLLTLSAMATALTALALYVAGNLGFIKLTAYFCSAIFVFALTTEGAFGHAILVYIASSAIGFLIVTSKINLLPYLALLGHYCIFKDYLDLKLKNRGVGFMFKMLYCNVFTAIGVLILQFVLNVDILTLFPDIPLGLIALALEIGFVTLELLSNLARNIYTSRIRNAIVRINRGA